MSKKEGHRLNLKIELELLETLRETARNRFNAPLHHVNGHPEISSTIIKLLELGLKALNDEDEYVYEEDKPISLKQKYEGLHFQFNSLATELDRLKERFDLLESAQTLTHIPIHRNNNIKNEELTQIPTQIQHTNIEDVDDDNLETLESNSQITTHTVTHTQKDESQITSTQIPIQIVDIKLDTSSNSYGYIQIPTQINQTKDDESTQIQGTKQHTNIEDNLKALEDSSQILTQIEPTNIECEEDLIKSKGGKPPAITSKAKVRAIREFALSNTNHSTCEHFGITKFTLGQIKAKKSPYDFD